MRGSSIDMLHGPLTGGLFRFAIPVAFIGILQQMFNTADIFVLGRYVGTEALAAMGSNAPVIGLLVNLFLGLSLGANVLIARFMGGRRDKESMDAIHTSFLLGILTGLSILVLGEVMAVPVLQWLGVPPEIMDSAELYLRVFLLGMPGMTLYDFVSSIYRAHGNVRTPLLALLAASLFNVAADLAAVWLGTGLAGVVATTALANYVSSGLLIYMLRHGHGVLHLVPGAIRLHRPYVREILRVGLPAGVQGMVFNLANLVIQSAINSEGALAMAASAAAFVLECNTYPFLIGFGQAITTFTSQNYGAGNLARCRTVARRGTLLSFVSISILSGLVCLFAGPLLSLFGLTDAGLAIGKTRVWLVVGFYFVSSIYESLSAALRGYGCSLPPALTMLVSICGVRLVWLATVYRAHPSFTYIMYCYPVSWTITAVLLVFLYRHYRNKISGTFGQ